jgi:mevalonate kinase
MNSGKGYGKTILFGEHFVVHGAPAIAAPLNLKTTAEIKKIKEKKISINDDLQKKEIEYKENSEEKLNKILKIIFNEIKINPANQSMKIKLKTNLPLTGGVGSSAALSAALANAMNKYFKKKYSVEKINSIAFESEKFFHGNPSGVDNSVAVYGTAIYFKKPNYLKKIKIKPLPLIIANSNMPRNTVKAVAEVKKLKEKNEKKFEEIMKKSVEITEKSVKELKKGNKKEIGNLMNQNQELLKKINVSNKTLEKMISIALNNEALGAKITGAGCGGNIIILPNKNEEKIINALKKEGFESIKTKIGVKA